MTNYDMPEVQEKKVEVPESELDTTALEALIKESGHSPVSIDVALKGSQQANDVLGDFFSAIKSRAIDKRVANGFMTGSVMAAIDSYLVLEADSKLAIATMLVACGLASVSLWIFKTISDRGKQELSESNSG